ncbi:MAG: cardiolipin synthase [Phycisphaerales bacterium]|nr:MAG: cardiolipin synthase [Phycisphaerales bacterium]
MSTVTTAFGILITLQAIFIAIGIVTERRHQSSKLAWLMILVLVPLLGLLFYMLFGRLRPALRMRARREANEVFEERILAAGERGQGLDPLNSLPPALHAVASITRRTSGAALTEGNSVDILSRGFSKFAALRAAIEQATQYVHMEYYIIRDDNTGRSIRDALIEARSRGVEVRLLIDGAGCFYLPDSWLRPLREAGARVATFLPIRFPFLTSRRDFRNHRKLVVIDGREAFLGGMNIGDEYSGYGDDDSAPTTWRDTHAHVVGPCVAGLDEVFAEDWFYATHDPLLRPDPAHWDTPAGDHIVQVVASGPDRSWPTFQQVAFSVITAAREQVNITTPYFVPDASILMALQTAALSGVAIRILVPGKSNHPLVSAAQRGFYPELLDAGVEIYEYQPGLIHAKTLVADDRYSLIGSANMDMRSFRLNFELGLSVIHESCARRLLDDFGNDLAQSRRFTIEDLQHRGPLRRFAYSAAQLTSPLL